MTYELKINPKLIALASAGAAVLGMTLDEALLRPIVTPREEADTAVPPSPDAAA